MNRGKRHVIERNIGRWKDRTLQRPQPNRIPPAVICLYYTDSPQKVFSAYDNLRVWYPLFIPAGILVCLLTMYLTGYFS